MVQLAADALAALPTDEIPGPLRALARFTPARRARHGASALAAALATDPVFRESVAARVTETAGPLGEAVATGVPPAAADPVEVAALAYLLRPVGWGELVETAAGRVRDEVARAERAARRAETDRLAEQLDRLRTQARGDVD